eukprot:CAMPEP_0171681272 /NCGR_PEP_ID=MMETSP0990-20121206/57280_1 /TAXON_ID=483369 /ORGANISM="non described non described, Strain CCMP2098" /LENGTH=306 /DNA_ID=CAMNT_0012268309 /DNA_START=227 /DNA_END=1147 /DNA_ORIENTATION=+
MTAVGTPIYCAPEISRGESYDEKVDVYSFGMTLLCMSVPRGDLPSFLSERYQRAYELKRAPKSLVRVMRPLTDGAWRPVGPSAAAAAAAAMPMGTTDAIESTETSASYDNGMMGGGVKLQTTMTSKQCALPSPPLGGLVPNGINDLLVQCCAHDPKVRPTFAECLSMLEGSIRDEVLRQESAPITQTAPTRNSAVTLARMDAGGGGGGAGSNDVEAGTLYPSDMNASAEGRLSQRLAFRNAPAPTPSPELAATNPLFGNSSFSVGGGGGGRGEGGGEGSLGVYGDGGSNGIAKRTNTVSVSELTSI